MQELFEKIKSHNWFLGIRRDESFLFYSMNTRGGRKHLPELGLVYVDRLLITSKKDYPVRVLDDDRASDLHGIMRERVLKNPKILSDYVTRDYKVLKELVKISSELNKSYKKNTSKKNLELFEKACDIFAWHAAYIYIGFAGGVQLAKYLDKASDKVAAKKSLREHDKWRNFVTFPEEEFGKNIFSYLSSELSGLKIKPIRDYKYLDIDELLGYLRSRQDNGLAQKIKERKGGFVFVALEDHFETITDKPFIKKVKGFLVQFEKSREASGGLKGRTAFGKGKVQGEVIKVLDIKKFSGSLKDKILVTFQTTPHFIPHLKGVKAIITDEGGVTCHAAIISREMKIPCIVGAKNATKSLKDGNQVEIDLDTGIATTL